MSELSMPFKVVLQFYPLLVEKKRIAGVKALPVKVPMSNDRLVGISYQENCRVIHLRMVVEGNLNVESRFMVHGTQIILCQLMS